MTTAQPIPGGGDTTVDWTTQLADQLAWHWTNHLRPRLEGLNDPEYFWEPVRGCWNIRLRGTSSAPITAGSGAYRADFAFPEPDPPPVTTIAWRLGHVIVGVLGMRVAGHFGGPPISYESFDYAGTAAEALTQLDDVYASWITGVRSLTGDELSRPSGSDEAPFAHYPMAALVLHISREVIHHGAEILLLRQLYRAHPNKPVGDGAG